MHLAIIFPIKLFESSLVTVLVHCAELGRSRFTRKSSSVQVHCHSLQHSTIMILWTFSISSSLYYLPFKKIESLGRYSPYITWASFSRCLCIKHWKIILNEYFDVVLFPLF